MGKKITIQVGVFHPIESCFNKYKIIVIKNEDIVLDLMI